MASKIKVDQLETADGSGTIALQNQLSGLASSSMPTGSVLQVASSTFTGTATGTQATPTLPHADCSVSITPTSSSSKILITVHSHIVSNRNKHLTLWRCR